MDQAVYLIFTISFQQPYLYKKTGIRIMTICPGITDTKMVSDVSTIVMDFIDGKFAVEEIKRYPFQRYVLRRVNLIFSHPVDHITT